MQSNASPHYLNILDKQMDVAMHISKENELVIRYTHSNSGHAQSIMVPASLSRRGGGLPSRTASCFFTGDPFTTRVEQKKHHN